MNNDILYLGDTSLQTAASYLAGCLQHAGRAFDYIPSQQPLRLRDVDTPHQLYILSDYPSVMLADEIQQRVLEHLRQGSNLLMIGGWESFHGQGGGWDRTPLAEVIPAKIQPTDDRQNCDSPVFMRPHSAHPITANLPWLERTPVIGGYNKVAASPEAQVLLTAERYRAQFSKETYELSLLSSDPLLIVSEHEQSRCTLLMTDLAPHWVGPFVDWGDERIAACEPGSEPIEIGSLYLKFVTQLIHWAGHF